MPVQNMNGWVCTVFDLGSARVRVIEAHHLRFWPKTQRQNYWWNDRSKSPGNSVAFVADHDRKEIYVGGPTVESVVGEKIAPRLMDRYLAHAAWEGAFRNEPDDPNRPDDFWQPVPGDHGSHGPFDGIAKPRSIQLWITMHRRSLSAALGAIAFTVFGLAIS